MSSKHRIIGLGEILWDLLPDGKELGGAPANFAYHAQALGASSCVVSCVGSDALGTAILALLDEVRLDRRTLAVDSAHPTGTVSVSLDAKGVPTYVIHTEVAWDFILWSDGLADLAKNASAVCFGSLGQRSPVSRQTIRAFLANTSPDSLRVFDVNLRQSFYDRDVIHESCALANIVKLNDEELPVIARLLGLRSECTLDLLRELVNAYSLKLVALTRGSRGSILCTPDEISEHAGHAARVVDTVGAGDSFTAAIVMGVLNGESLDHINDSANRLASYVCSQKGAMPRSIPSDFLWRNK